MRRDAAVLAALWAVAVAIGLGARGYWNPDEPRHAEVAREMAKDGHWWKPHRNGEPYPDKPPLFFWIVAAAGLVGDFATWATRLPTALAALGCGLTLYALGRRMYGRRTGLAAAVVLLTSGEFLWLAQRVEMNIWVTWCVLGAVAAGVVAVQEQRRGLWAAVFLLMGLGIILKGPVVPGMILAILLPWMIIGFGWASLRQVPWWMVPLAAAGPLLWAGPLWLQGERAYLAEMVVGHALGRVVDSESHRQPIYYYLYAYAFATLPWVVFVPWAWWQLVRDRERLSRARRWLPIVWVAVPLVLMSAVSAKRSLYLLPAVPGLALALGWWLAEAQRSRAPAVIVALLLVAVGCGVLVAEPGLLPEPGWGGMAIAVALGVGAALTLRGETLRGIALALVLASLAFRLDVAGRLNPWLTADRLAADLEQERIVPDAAVGFDASRVSLALNRTVDEVPVERLEEVAKQARWLLVRIGGRGSSEERLSQLGFDIHAEYRLGRRVIVLADRGCRAEPSAMVRPESEERPARRLVGEAPPWEEVEPLEVLHAAGAGRWLMAGALVLLALAGAMARR